MTSEFLAIGSALYSYLSSAATVSVYDNLAPQGGTPPYCIVQRQAGIQTYTMDPTEFTSTDYVVKVVSNRHWPGEARFLYEHIGTAMQDAALSLSGWALMRCRRQASLEYRDPEGSWHVGHIYRIDAEGTA